MTPVGRVVGVVRLVVAVPWLVVAVGRLVIPVARLIVARRVGVALRVTVVGIVRISGAAGGEVDSFCDSILAQIATAGLLAAPRSRQEAARSLRKATAFLAAPHQAVMMISPSLHCTAQAAASQLERTTRNDAEPGGAGIPAA